MKTCKKCNLPAELLPTEERQEVITWSDSLGKRVIRSCPVYEHCEFCFYHRKESEGFFAKTSLTVTAAERFWNDMQERRKR